MQGISQRQCITKGWDEFDTNRNVFLKFWTEYISNKNIITSGYIISPCERNLLLENEIIFSERDILIPSIEIGSEKNCILVPICFSERTCDYKKYFIEETDRNCILFPICFNEKYVYIHFLKEHYDNKYIKLSSFEGDYRHILTQLPPQLTKYNFRNLFVYFLPPNSDEKKIYTEQYHMKIHLPREFDRYFILPPDTTECDRTSCEISCYHYDYTDSTSVYDITYCVAHEHIHQEYYDGNRFIYEIDSDLYEYVDGTVTSDFFELIEVGLDEGFDYGELFLVDLENRQVFNLSLDSLFDINIYGQHSRELYLISNQNNLFISCEPITPVLALREKFPTLADLYEDNDKFKAECYKEIFKHNYLRISIHGEKVLYYPKIFKRFPRRFLVPFDIYVDDEIRTIISGIRIKYYFPYRFKNQSKRYKAILSFNIL